MRIRKRNRRGQELEFGACLGMKSIGKPGAGKPHERFDEGALLASAVAQRGANGTLSSRLQNVVSILFDTDSSSEALSSVVNGSCYDQCLAQKLELKRCLRVNLHHILPM
ncbi:MAG: hypothetical protein D3910_04855 [Candidatus Electrothrix sp. ATG2]|nr:hypothetical protein [Candidatus Electrothrix sp. ATG2]